MTFSYLVIGWLLGLVTSVIVSLGVGALLEPDDEQRPAPRQTTADVLPFSRRDGGAA